MARWLTPDSLVGTDSHTTMINGLGVVGWGVGGIEAEACMLGQPIYIPMPEVIGFRLTGKFAGWCHCHRFDPDHRPAATQNMESSVSLSNSSVPGWIICR